jgi:CHAD domain-containing protein
MAPPKRDTPATTLPGILDKRWRRLRKTWERVQEDYSRNAVHDLRVAIRRFTSAVDVCAYLEAKLHSRKCRKALKSIFETSSPVRDLQVERAWIAQSLPDHPELAGFDAAVTIREAAAIRKLRKALRGEPKPPQAAAAARKRLLDELKQRSSAQMRNAAVEAASAQFERVLRRLSKVDPAEVATIHRVRVALKRFRYAAEVAQPLDKRIPPRVLEDSRVAQSKLGAIQDLEVLMRDLRRWNSRESGGDPRIEAVLAQLESQHKKHISAFLSLSERQRVVHWPFGRQAG